jgi:hypothetical protein
MPQICTKADLLRMGIRPICGTLKNNDFDKDLINFDYWTYNLFDFVQSDES